jgi:hypothetical protein
VHCEPKKHHPCLRPSEWRRLACTDWVILLCLQLGKGAPILSTWAIIASWPAWPLHFFTGVFQVDVTRAESRLIHFFYLSVVFISPINIAGVQSHLLCLVFFRAFAFCFVHSYYFRCARSSHAWFKLNLLPMEHRESSVEQPDASLDDVQAVASTEATSKQDAESDEENPSGDTGDSGSTSDNGGRMKIGAEAALAGMSYDFGQSKIT